MQIDNTLSRWQLVPLYFSQAAVAASQTNVQLYTSEVATPLVLLNTGYVMPWEGKIVAISANLDTAATAGSLTVGATVGGTEGSDPTLSITTETEKYDTAPRTAARFAVGAVIGAEITSSATWDATTSDLNVIVWVLLKVSGI